MEDSRWKDIYNCLKNEGLKVYSPGQKQGECLEPYVVVKSSGLNSLEGISSSRELFDIMCYVPKDNYSELDLYVNKVEDILDNLFPMVRPVHYRTPSYLDDSVKAHMISIQYMNYKKNKRR